MAEAKIVAIDENKETIERTRMENHWSSTMTRMSNTMAVRRWACSELPGSVKKSIVSFITRFWNIALEEK